MIRILKNDLTDNYAAPRNHPITCANDKPWKIIEMRIEQAYYNKIKISIRGENTMWFLLDNCDIGSKEELQDLVDKMEMENLISKLYFSYSI